MNSSDIIRSGTDNNEMWKLEPGYIAAYTEDKELIKKIKRNKSSRNWEIMAEYFKGGKMTPFAVQYKIPAEQKAYTKRMFFKDEPRPQVITLEVDD